MMFPSVISNSVSQGILCEFRPFSAIAEIIGPSGTMKLDIFVNIEILCYVARLPVRTKFNFGHACPKQGIQE